MKRRSSLSYGFVTWVGTDGREKTGTYQDEQSWLREGKLLGECNMMNGVFSWQ